MAFSFSVDTADAKATLKSLGATDGPLRRAIVKQLRRTAQEIKAEAQGSVQRKSGGGKLYRQGTRRFGSSKKKGIKGGTAFAFYRASAPGEPPVSVTGALARRFGVGISRTKLLAGIFANAPHAHLMEYGTAERIGRGGRRAGRVAPRPFLQPPLRRRADVFADRVAEAFDEVFRL